MQSNCTLNVTKCCLGAIVITIVIDSTQKITEKKLPDTKTSYSFQKTDDSFCISVLLSLA